MSEYWLITYSWQGQSDRILSNCVHKGSIGEWIIKSLDEPESYILINHAYITKDEYEKMQFAF